jgi:protein-arginine kinase activator protein McsA
VSDDCPIFNFPCSKQKNIQHNSSETNDSFQICQSCPYAAKLQENKSNTCQSCGMTFDDLLKTNLFGCGNCYSFFEVMARAIIIKCQSSINHNGKSPACMEHMTISKLNIVMAKAIQVENYELAAECKKLIDR